MATAIASEDLIDIETSFKVTAGPGAGKTHWLSSHIRHVLRDSKRLGITRKIACISYTNVGADTIMSRLPIGSSSIVEVCTIHSFLYKHILKPFLQFNATGINIEELHIEPPKMFLTKGFAIELLEENNNNWIHPDSLLNGLAKCQWKYKNHKFGDFKPNYPQKAVNLKGIETKYSIPNNLYDAYVSKRWEKGSISYDDIIYLSLTLISKQPDILNSIKAKFPYFFIDEFQDSPPPIVDFVKKMGEEDIVVGVVGDVAQTIYSFIGASVEQFENFSVPNMKEYEIHGNRRSTSSIISLLNHLRPDFTQESINTEMGTPPTLLIGDKLQAFEKAIDLCKTIEIHSLAFQNIVANSMQHGDNIVIENDKLLDEAFNDSNMERARIMRTLLKATEYAHQNNFKEALILLDIIDDNRAKTIGYLRKLLKQRNSFIRNPLYCFYQFLKNELNIKITNFRERSNNKQFYLSHNYKDLAVCIDIADVDGIHKTIHKAKGEEYDNVMVILGKEGVDVLVNPDLGKNLAHRVYYVGMSRARKNLFINVEGVDENQMEVLEQLPINILPLTENL